MVNIVGDHATYHRQVRRAADLRHRGAGAARLALGQDLARCEGDRRRRRRGDRRRAHAAGPDRDLILPADTAWNEGSGPAAVPPRPARAGADARCGRRGGAVLRSGEPTLILVTGRAVRDDGLELAGAHRRQDRRAADRAGLERAHRSAARGRVSVERIPYVVDQALEGAGRAASIHPGRRRRCRWRSSPIPTSRAC